MIECDKILQGIVCFLCDGEVPPLAIPASRQRGLRQRNTTLVLDLADIGFEALAQRGKLRGIGDHLGQVIGDIVVEDGFQSERWRNVVARRPGANPRLLFLRHVPLQIESGSVGMGGILEDCAKLSPDRDGIGCRERHIDRLAFALLHHRMVQHHVEGREALSGAHAAYHAEVTLNELRLGCHIVVHILPAVFLDDGLERKEGRVIVVWVGRDQLAAEHGLEKIERRSRRVLARHQLGIEGRRDREHVDRRVRPVRVAKARIERLESLHLERQQRALPLPADEFLHRLEGHEIDVKLAVRNLLVDRGRKSARITAGHPHFDAGEARLVLFHPAFIEPRRSAAIDRQRALAFRPGVDLVEGLGTQR